jgi:diadenylate cyclase
MEATRGCDAIAVVTSEETGIISIAENGELFRGITDAELREKLMLYLLEEDAEKPIATKFRKIFKGGKKNG